MIVIDDGSGTVREMEWASLFDGQTLAGWHPVPRIYGPSYPGGPSALARFDREGLPRPVSPEDHAAVWTVEDGAIVGRQDTPGSGYGGYLVTDDSYANFELELQARPDWPADTGIMVRRGGGDDWTGFQILLDHREHGGIGGYFGNGLGAFSALPFAIRSLRAADGTVIGLQPDDPADSPEPVTAEKIARLDYACDVSEFVKIWRWDEWNDFRIRVEGRLPVISVWINGLLISRLDTARIVSPNYNAAKVLEVLGDRGHIALEVHDNDAVMGAARWGVGACCRWRQLRIRELPPLTVPAPRPAP